MEVKIIRSLAKAPRIPQDLAPLAEDLAESLDHWVWPIETMVVWQQVSAQTWAGGE
jgi:hypothetical protein